MVAGDGQAEGRTGEDSDGGRADNLGRLLDILDVHRPVTPQILKEMATAIRANGSEIDTGNPLPEDRD